MPPQRFTVATTAGQQKVISSLAGLAGAVRESGLESPVTTIIGDVVALSDKLDWFQSECQANERDITYDPVNLARA